jgi:hypothetical protein
MFLGAKKTSLPPSTALPYQTLDGLTPLGVISVTATLASHE